MHKLPSPDLLLRKNRNKNLNTSTQVLEAISSKSKTQPLTRGEEYFQEQVDLYGIIDHESEYYQKINTIFTHLLQNERLSAYIHQAQLEILITDYPTAFKIGGTDKICISIGMIKKYCTLINTSYISEDIVAFILTHELVHQKYSNKDTSSRDDIDKKVAGYILPREEEKIADKEAMFILNECGYNPDAGLKFFEGLQQNNDDDGAQDVLMDFFTEGYTHIFDDPHESTSRRIAYLKQQLEENTYKHKDVPHKELMLDEHTISKDQMSFLNTCAHGNIHEARGKIKNINQAFFFAAMVTQQSHYSTLPIGQGKHNLVDLLSEYIPQSYTHLMPVIIGMCTHTLQGHSDTFFVDLCEKKKLFEKKQERKYLLDIIAYTIQHADPDTRYETIGNLHEVMRYNNKTRNFLKNIIFSYPSIRRDYQKYLINLQVVDFTDMAEIVFSCYLDSNQTKDLSTKQRNEVFNFYKNISKKLAKDFTYKFTPKIIDHLYKSTLNTEDKITLLAHSIDITFSKNIGDQSENTDQDNDPTNWILTHTHGIPRQNREYFLLAVKSSLLKSEYQRTPLISYQLNNSKDISDPYSSTTGDQYRHPRIKNMLGLQERHFKDDDKQYIPTEITNIMDTIAQSDISEDELLHIMYSLFNEYIYIISLGRYKEILLSKNTSLGKSVWGKLVEQVIIEFASNAKKANTKQPLRISQLILYQHLQSAGLSTPFLLSAPSEQNTGSEKEMILINKGDYHMKSLSDFDPLDIRDINSIHSRTFGLGGIVSLIQQLSEEHDKTNIVNTLISLFATSEIIEHQDALKSLLPVFTDKDLKQHIYSIIEGFFKDGTIPPGVTDFGRFIESLYLPQQVQVQDKLYEILREDLLKENPSMSADEKLSMLQHIFPSISLKKEKEISEVLLEEHDEELTKSFLPKLNFPHIHNKLVTYLLDTYTKKATFDEQLSDICNLLPKKSLFRDHLIKDTMNQYSIAIHKLSDIKALLFEESILFEPTTEVLYQYGGIQLLAQIFYYCPIKAKQHLFTEYCKSISQPHEQFTTQEQTAYVFSNFFSGEESLFSHEQFEDLFRLLFISLKESDEVTSLFIQLQKIEEQLTYFKPLYEEFSDENDEDNIYNNPRPLRDYSKHPMNDTEAKVFWIEFQLKLIGKFHHDGNENSESDGSARDLEDLLSIIYMLKGYKKYLEKKIGLLPMKEIDLLVSIIHVVMKPFSPQEQGIIMGKFFAAFQYLPEKSLEQATPLFLESIGTLFSKVGQYLATLGIIKNPKIVQSLQKLMHSIRPDDMFRMVETRKQSGVSLDKYFSLGPLLGSASSRQSYANTDMTTANSGVSKIKRQHALSTIRTQAERLLKIVEIANNDPLLSAYRLPKNMITTAIEEAEAEVLTNLDIQKQQRWYDRLNNKIIAGVKWHVPGIKLEDSNEVVQNDTLLFEGFPLGKNSSIPQETKQAVLDMIFYMLTEYYAFHGDLNFGNILQSSTDSEYCLIDFANATQMSKEEYISLLTLIGLFTQFIENFESIIAFCIHLHINNGGSLHDIDGEWLIKLTQRMKKNIEKNNIQGLQFLTQQITDFFVILESNNLILPKSITTLIKGLGQITYFIEDNYEKIAVWYFSEQQKHNLNPTTIDVPSDINHTIRNWQESIQESSHIEIPSKTTIKVGKRIYTLADAAFIKKGASIVRLTVNNESTQSIEDSTTLTLEFRKEKEQIHKNVQVLLGGTYVTLRELVREEE